ncbi:MAG: MFS transporter [Dermatophilaceae bacterium]
MLRLYGELFSIRGAVAFSVTGLLSRLPISQFNIAIILLISATTGSYGLAGQVAGAAALAGAIGMPPIARLVDRLGQARVTRPVIVVGATAWCGFAYAVGQDWPTWTWFALAVVGGVCGPNMGAMVRARWVHVLPDATLQRRAFAWESSLDEIVFVIGPPLAAFLATSIAPQAGVLVAAAILVGGGWAFTAQKSTEPPPAADRPRGGKRGLLSPAFVAVAGVFFCCGTMFGAIDVIAIAFADERGSRAVAGGLLAAVAVGSLCSGLAFGVLSLPRSVGAQFVSASCVPSVLMPLLLLAGNLWQLALLLFLCGFAIAPILITATMLVERLVPPWSLTEGLTWTVTALVGGVTLGAALGGYLSDVVGPHQAFWLSSAAAWAAGATALLSSPLLRHAAVERVAQRSASGPHT